MVGNKARLGLQAERFAELGRRAREIAAFFQGEPEIAVAGRIVWRQGNRAAERSHSLATPPQTQESQRQVLVGPGVLRRRLDQPLQQLDRADVRTRRLVQPGKFSQRRGMARIKLEDLLINPGRIGGPPGAHRLLRTRHEALDIAARRFGRRLRQSHGSASANLETRFTARIRRSTAERILLAAWSREQRPSLLRPPTRGSFWLGLASMFTNVQLSPWPCDRSCSAQRVIRPRIRSPNAVLGPRARVARSIRRPDRQKACRLPCVSRFVQ